MRHLPDIGLETAAIIDKLVDKIKVWSFHRAGWLSLAVEWIRCSILQLIKAIVLTENCSFFFCPQAFDAPWQSPYR